MNDKVKNIENKAIGILSVALSILTIIGAVTVGIKAAKEYLENNRVSPIKENETND